MYYEINNTQAVDWMKNLISNTLANPNHNTTISYYNELVAWQDALQEPVKLPEVAQVKPSVTRKPIKKIGKKKNVPYECSEHSTYGGVRTPRTNCNRCWDIYKELHPMDYSLKRRKFEMKANQG